MEAQVTSEESSTTTRLAPCKCIRRKRRMMVGRQDQLDKLLEAYHDASSNNNKVKVAVIIGPDGSGRTAMVEALRDYVRQQDKNGGIFSTTIKFDSQPPAVLKQIANQTCVDIIRKYGPKAVHQGVSEYQKKQGVGSDVDSTINVRGHTPCRTYDFLSLLKAVRSSSQTLVIVGENAHCAGKDTLRHLSTLLDLCDGNVLFVCTSVSSLPELHRDDDEIVEIRLLDLTLEETHKVADDVLESDSLGTGVSDVVYRLTGGNYVFIDQTLMLLRESSSTSNIEEAERCLEGCESVEDIVRRRFQRLDKGTQRALRHAALVGSPIDTVVLGIVLSPDPIEPAVETAVHQGFLVEEDYGGRQTLRFTNACIQRAIVELVPEQATERSHVHYLIGKKLLKAFSKKDELLHEFIFVVMDQLRRGESCMRSTSERQAAATLCFAASKRAAKESQFGAALSYLEFGIRLAGSWSDNYELNLALHNQCCEIMYCTGDIARAEQLGTEIVQHSRCLEDQLQAAIMRVYSFNARGMLKESIQDGLKTLEQLGVSMKAKPTRLSLLLDYLKTRKVLRNKSDEALMRLPTMTDPCKLATMQLLVMMLTSAVHVVDAMAPQLMLRMCLYTLENGLCGASSVAFAAYGMCLSGLAKQEEGYRFGKLALRLLHHHKHFAYTARVYCICYGYVLRWNEPFREIAEPLAISYTVGLETGDMEFAAVSMMICTFHRWNSGESLGTVCKQLLVLSRLMKTTPENSIFDIAQSFQLMVTNLVNGYDSELVGNLIHQNEETVKAGKVNVYHWICYNHALVAFMFGDYDLAESENQKAMEITTTSLEGPEHCEIFLLHALIALSLVTRGDKSKPRRRRLAAARKGMRLTRNLARRCPENGLDRLLLAKADYVATAKSVRTDLFMVAAGVCCETGWRLGSGLTHERWGRHLLRSGDKFGAKARLRKAVSFYREWGAVAKAAHLMEEVRAIK